jgi:hypothetical protein
MPRLTLANEQVRVYDDLLPPADFDALLHHATSDNYAIVHRQGWQKAWRLGDGLPLHGSTTYYRPDPSLYAEHEQPRYPTQTPLDRFIESMNDVAGDAADVLGEWNGVTVGPWVYPLGAGLSLHRNAPAYAGSYAFFVHPDWNFHWGGQLLVLDRRTGDGGEAGASHWLFDERESRAGMDPGLGLCILPKPNRLVFIAASAFQMITRVDVNAGNHPHVTVAGFFLGARS